MLVMLSTNRPVDISVSFMERSRLTTDHCDCRAGTTHEDGRSRSKQVLQSAIPESLQQPTERYLWAQRPAEEVDLVRLVAAVQAPGPDGDGTLSRPVYDVPHLPRPWGARVSGYLWTKAIAAGALMVAAAAALVGPGVTGSLAAMAAPIIALIFLMVTTVLLIADLKRPDRFHYLLLKPNPRSWLVWGAWILMAYGSLATLWFLAGLTGRGDVIGILAVPALVLGAAAAGYTAFLFRQAEGRDFWQSPLRLPHLLVGAMVAGVAALLLAQLVVPGGPDRPWLATVLVAGLGLHGLVLLAELGGAHTNLDTARAARLLTHGVWRGRFWLGVVVAGIVVPAGLAFLGAAGAAAAGLLALGGLWLYEDLWVKAGQALPLS